jgi:L,D-transpeptidase YcbB
MDAMSIVRRPLATSLGLFMFLLGGSFGAIGQASAQTNAQADPAVLRSIVAAAELPPLKQPKFADHQETAQRFYEPAAYGAAWLKGTQPTRQALQAVDVLSHADGHGLDPEDYDATWIGGRLRSSSSLKPNELAALDAAISVSLFRYLSDVRVGRINPRAAHFKIDPAPKPDLAQQVRSALATDSLPQLAAASAPQLPMYERLRKVLPRYRQLAADTSLAPVPELKRLVPGSEYAGAAALERLLVVLGDAQPPAVPASRYEGSLVEAVKRFQLRHGLIGDGVIAKDTFAALNAPMAWRVRQIVLAMERLRWAPSFESSRLIKVNIPEFSLRAVDVGPEGPRTRFVSKVIVGKSADSTRTPVFSKDMLRIEFSPQWNVPPSIATKEILPKVRRDPSYLARHNMELVSTSTGRAIGAEGGEGLGGGGVRIRQRAGAHNALGKIKFVMPNDMNIYLHHTPSVGLFARTRRDFSHGCIRVEEPVRVAQFVLENQPEWNEKRIRDAMARSRTQTVQLTKPVPVLIFYSTAVVEEDGRVLFLPDVYGYDKPMDVALRTASRSSRPGPAAKSLVAAAQTGTRYQ